MGSGAAPAAVENKNDAKALKETAVPNELFQAVEEFKKYVKEEKSISSDIVHMSPKVCKIIHQIQLILRTGFVLKTN